MEIFSDFLKFFSTIDLIYICLTILSLIKCYKNGFVLSVLAMSKWLLAYILTLIIFPQVKPYVKDLIDNEYVLDIVLGISIFVIVVFIVLLISKGISKAIKYTGLGRLDSIFGFFFGFIRAYIICLCFFSGAHIVYNYEKWPINLDKSFVFPYLEKGSNYLLKEFPDEKTYQNSKEKIKDL